MTIDPQVYLDGRIRICAAWAEIAETAAAIEWNFPKQSVIDGERKGWFAEAGE